ncbi:MAG: ABC transporter permease [Firmicutes bacterium]|nr:ABC transporter permease [Bacillota bacterium]HXL04032.1 ABC transporter permease [Bacillota bacterium]
MTHETTVTDGRAQTTQGRKFKIRVERRLDTPAWWNILVPVVSIALALLFGAIFLKMTGYSPIKVYAIMFKDTFGTKYGITETLVKASPLLLSAVGVSIAFRMQLWNIGAEGQIYVGALAASWVALTFTGLPAYIMIPAMVLAAALAGGLWAFLGSAPRAIWGVNEIITTLMLNYIAIFCVEYFVYGPWRDPLSFLFPLSPMFPKSAWLPCFGNTRIHLGLVFGVVSALAVGLLLSRTKWGYEIRVIGENPDAARYSGMSISRNIILVMILSGAISGIAGMCEVSGIIHRLQAQVSAGYGYTAIIIAWLAKLHPIGIIIVSLLFGGLLVAGYSVQIYGIPADIATMLQGSLLFFVLGVEALARYRIRIIRSSPKPVQAQQAADDVAREIT